MSNVIKFALLLIGALLIALIVRVVIASVSGASAPKVNTQRVRVSAAELPQGLLLREDDLRWKNLPIDQTPSNAIIFGASGVLELKGALLRHSVQAGAVLTGEDVILPSDPGFLAATLQPGMRAVSVAVDDVSGNAGLIQPGDYVDVLLTQQMDRKTELPDYSVSSETIIEHVRVLASGSEIVRPKNANANEIGNRARTVTLEVTPRMTEIVAVAARLGSLSLSLRSFATDTRNAHMANGLNGLMSPTPPAVRSDAELQPVWAGQISRALRQLPQARAAAAPREIVMPPTIAIYRGSDKGERSVNTARSIDASGGAAVMPPLPIK
jgi:pilus assembly protein CpaB